MDWLRSKTTAVAAGFFALIAFQGYGLMSMRNNVEDRIGAVERDLQDARAQDESKISQLSSALNVVTERMGINAQELKQAHAIGQALRISQIEIGPPALRIFFVAQRLHLFKPLHRFIQQPHRPCSSQPAILAARPSATRGFTLDARLWTLDPGP